MTKEEVFAYVEKTYRVRPDQPWEKAPENYVFRHGDTGKWFALVMPVRADKLGLQGTAFVDVVTLKCDPMLIDVLSRQEGCHRAYHMNKTLWMTVELNDKVPEDRVKDWIDLSFDLTDKRDKAAKKGDAGMGRKAEGRPEEAGKGCSKSKRKKAAVKASGKERQQKSDQEQ